MTQKPSLVVRIDADVYDLLMKSRKRTGDYSWSPFESTSAVIRRLLTPDRKKLPRPGSGTLQHHKRPKRKLVSN